MNYPATKYRTIVIDPPWDMPNGGGYKGDARWKTAKTAHQVGELPYQTLSNEALSTLPIGGLADGNCHLYLWVPNYHLEAAYSISRAWGFKPSVLLVWAKTPRGIGLGGAYTCTTEFALFCRRGTLKASQRLDTTWWNWKRPHNAHSAKPEGFLDVVEQVSPAPRLEIFARRARFGWDYAGDGSLGTVEIPGLRAPGRTG